MILKGPKNSEVKEIDIVELEERMHKFGHTDFIYKCQHGLTQMTADPHGTVPKEVCLGCGKEVVREEGNKK